MKMFRYAAMSLVLVICVCLGSCKRQIIKEFHVFEINEILLTAEDRYDNPYTDVEGWVDLEGPGFSKRIYGFWDGGQQFKVRVTAIQPGDWSWKSGSTSTSDKGLNDKSGNFRAIAWTEQEKEANDNRRGFVRPTANGRALEYADGTPFFFIGDTWWAAPTWRYPLTGKDPDPDWVPGPLGISFENIVHYRQKQGYNSLAMLYFENKCEAPGITSLIPDKEYQMKWFDPMTGEWLADVQNVSTDGEGMMFIGNFPDGEKISTRDWSLKLISN